jgi:large subunit ribosomal protein L21
MYAVIETGGKQYRVAPGDSISVEKLVGEPGSTVQFKVLAVSNDSGDLLAGKDVASSTVKATIESHGRGDKVIVFKFKRKKQYKKTQGHRQDLTKVKISEIVA